MTQRGSSPSSLGRLAVWTLPVFNVLIAVAAQILVPRLLQLGLSERDYTVYVALTSVAAYVGLGEGGVLISLLRELAARHGAGDRAGFLVEARRSRKLFVIAACLGGILATTALATQREALGGRGGLFLAGAVVLVIGAMSDLAFGSFQTAMLLSTGRFLIGQLIGVATVVVPLTSLVIALLVTKNLTTAVWAQALAWILLSIARGVHAAYVYRGETEGVEAHGEPAPLVTVVGPGALLKLAEVVQTASYPHLLSVLAPAFVPGAIPARTYANATKLVTQQFVNLLQVHVTRGLAGNAEQRANARDNYELAATFLTSSQLLQIGVAAAVARPVFRAWLPNQEPYIDSLLPGVLAWQALLAACLPADILFVAAGHLRLLGVIRFVATTLGLGAVALTLGWAGRGALGLGLSLSAIPLFVFGLWGELSLLADVAPPRRQTILRYGLSLGGALACATYATQPWLAAVTCCGAGLVGLPRSVPKLWRLIRPSSDERHRTDHDAHS